MFRPFGEDNDLVRFQDQGPWSLWRRAMVPTSHGRYTENRGPDQPGYMWSNIRNVLNEVAGLCGIYEFQVRGTLPGQLQGAIVYVGSTCPRGADGRLCRKLNSRIINYSRHGNHKAFQINDALSSLGNIMFWYGFKAWIRGHKFIMEESSGAYTNIVDILRILDQANQVTCGRTSEMC